MLRSVAHYCFNLISNYSLNSAIESDSHFIMQLEPKTCTIVAQRFAECSLLTMSTSMLCTTTTIVAQLRAELSRTQMAGCESPLANVIHSVIHCVMSKGDSMVFTDTVLEAGASQRVRLYSEIGDCTNACAGAWGNIIDNNLVRTGPDMVEHIDCTKSCHSLCIYN